MSIRATGNAPAFVPKRTPGQAGLAARNTARSAHRLGPRIANSDPMTVRERIWRYIDDAEPERHGSLRDALYRLLVVSEVQKHPAASIDRCLDLAAEAIRDGSAVAVVRARMVVDEVVVLLAGEVASTDRVSC
jgi:hypothetical protein